MSLPPFDRPFGAGASAEFAPGSLTTEFSLTREELRDLDPGPRMAQALASAARDAKRGAIFASIPWAAKQFLAVRAHELDHLHRMLSTTFGFLTDVIRCEWLKQSGRLIRERAESPSKSLYPLLSLPKSKAKTFDEALREIERPSETVSPTARLVMGQTNLLAALTDTVSPPRFASALWGLSNAQPDRVHRLRSRPDGSNVSPPVERTEIGRGLSARHLLELFAIGEHGNGFLRTGSSLEEVVSLLGDAQQEYSAAALAWNAAFPEAPPPRVGSHGSLEGDLMFDWYRLYHFELFIAADLALWPPFFPVHGLGVDGELTWDDIDPGRRFERILAALQELRIQPLPIPAEGRNERFLDIQDRVCRRYGWPTPQRLAGLWLGHLRNHRDGSASTWFALDGHSTYRVDNAVKLLELRESRPADFALNNVDFNARGVEGAPVWILRESDGRKAPLPMGKLESKLVLPLMMIEGTRHMFNRDRSMLTPVYDAKFRESTVESLGRMMEVIADWGPGLLTRFLDETHREFRTKYRR